MMDDREIDKLVARAQRGDSEAAGAIYDHYVDRVVRFVRFRLGSAHDAEDVTQRVFLQMIEALPRYRARGVPFGAWIFRITRNAIIDHRRMSRPHAGLEAASGAASSERGPEELAVTAAEMRRVSAAIERLTEDQREVVVLRYLAGLSPSEIAAVMGRRPGAIRGIQFRALQALRGQLQSVASELNTPDHGGTR